MFNNLGNLADLMRNAGKIRETIEKATEALGQLQVEGTAGGGVGHGEGQRPARGALGPDRPKLLADGDAELLEDLVTAAVNQGLTKAREAAAQSISARWPAGCRSPGFPGLLGAGPDGGGGA